ncbi:MAG: PP2C family protein-serine/threonine phosphatase [Clostridia bacterium]|nr:PP2C family protein-serine/threonine phosphatase [Clostridia bacterium]
MEQQRKRGIGIIPQVAIYFVIGVLLTGILTYFMQRRYADNTVRQQMESFGARIAEDVMQSVREYPASQWLLQYWYEHPLDVEYDADFGADTRTEEKCRLFSSRHPDLQLRCATAQALSALPEEDQKLYAEIAYSWLITRVNQIKRSYAVDYLFCVVTDSSFKTQFFLFSGADKGAVRGTNYEEVYPLGTVVTVSEELSAAMRSATLYNSHLANAGGYVDYYTYMGAASGRPVLIGMTYDRSGLIRDVVSQTGRSAAFALIYQVALSLFCLALIFFFVLRPLRKVQQSIRLYKLTKKSDDVTQSLSAIRTRNEIGRLADDVTALAAEIDDYLTRIAAISAEKERISTELALASRIQANTIPHVFPPFPQRRDFDLYADMDPAREVGGDFYDYFLIDENHLALAIADVSGKGVPAALFMMISMILLHLAAKDESSPGKILASLNAQICENNPEEMFVSVWLGILDTRTGEMTCANAGHEYPILIRKDGSVEVVKDKHGFVIGGMDGMRYRDYTLILGRGDKLFVYTDGLPEATDGSEQMFGMDRIQSALEEAAGGNPESILESLRRAVNGFVGEAEQFDDLTMLCLAYHGQQASPAGGEAPSPGASAGD